MAAIALVWLAGQGASHPGAGNGSDTTTVFVTYHLTGSAKAANITYVDAAGNIQQQTSVSVPMIRESDGQSGLSIQARHGQYVSFLAQNRTGKGTLDCDIWAAGTVINTGHASGGYAIVTCSATVP